MELEEMVVALQAIQEWCQNTTCKNCPFRDGYYYEGSCLDCMFSDSEGCNTPYDWNLGYLSEKISDYLKEREK